VEVRILLLQQKLSMKKFLLFLKKIKDLFDPSYWAELIFIKTGLRDKAMNSKVRKFERSLTGWKFWTYQIVVGGIVFVVLEYLINFIGLTMIPF
jgi:hypothetical protein